MAQTASRMLPRAATYTCGGGIDCCFFRAYDAVGCDGEECHDGGWIGNENCDPHNCENWGVGCSGGSPPVGGSGNTPVPPCGDARDQLIKEYDNFHVTFSVGCASFTQSSSSQYFQFSEFNTGNYAWAIIQASLQVPSSAGFGLSKWREEIGIPRIINSAYRNPARNAGLYPPGAPQSRHMHGNAVDLRNVTRTTAEYDMMAKAAAAANAGFIEPLSGPCGLGCVHADWRNYTSEGTLL